MAGATVTNVTVINYSPIVPIIILVISVLIARGR
jgi:hypothetical protein